MKKSFSGPFLSQHIAWWCFYYVPVSKKKPTSVVGTIVYSIREYNYSEQWWHHYSVNAFLHATCPDCKQEQGVFLHFLLRFSSRLFAIYFLISEFEGLFLFLECSFLCNFLWALSNKKA